MVAFSNERPIFPPLHSLGLLNPSSGANDYLDESYDNATCPRLHIPQWRHSRQVSTATSRSSSPTLFEISSTSRLSSPATDDGMLVPPTPVLSISPLSSRAPTFNAPPNAPPLRFRLEPCSLGEAQAVLLVPPPSAPFIPSSSMPTPQQKQQALLLLGSSLEYFRQPQRQLAKGARVHPYRITPSQRKDFRRSSGSTPMSTPAPL
ncbi:hypothetical protein C0991_010355 [Blastosporella zonata]|nr:hypothetical protein C0991_010355 [Blastosporella zonata]